jgi:hypothetical protein
MLRTGTEAAPSSYLLMTGLFNTEWSPSLRAGKPHGEKQDEREQGSKTERRQ